jgi:hypothetical protein
MPIVNMPIATKAPSSHHDTSLFSPPLHFVCPILRKVMIEPVVSKRTGINFESVAIKAWQALHGGVCPFTGGELGELTPNVDLLSRITEWQHEVRGKYRTKKHHTFASVASTEKLKHPEHKDKKQPASSFIASQKLKKRKLNESVPPAAEQFEKVLRLVHIFTSHAVETDQKHVKAKSYKHDNYANQYRSIFRHGPSLNLPKL